jgi:hypothetical protein
MTQLLEIDGKKIFLVGTAHVSEESARLVAMSSTGKNRTRFVSSCVHHATNPSDRKTSGRKWTS